MYDYGYDYLLDIIAGFGLLGSIIGIVIAVVVSAYSVAPYVANAVIFMKAGDAPWKSLIPIYDVYTYCKLCKKPILFILYLAFGVAAALSGIFMFAALTRTLSYYDDLSNGITIWAILLAVFAIGTFVIYIFININIAKAFGRGAGTIFGLIFLNTIFKMILAFGAAEYQYIDKSDKEKTEPVFKPGYIEFITGDRAGARKELLNGESIIIGRDPQVADFVVDRATEGSRVSRRHCEVQYVAEHNVFYVTDLSSNGTTLEDGTKLLANVKTPIKRGTIIILPKDVRFIVK